MSTDEQERLINLLADGATQSLSPEELTELEELLKKYPSGDDLQLDLAAAAVDLSAINVDEPLPANLRDKVLADAYQYLDATKAQAQSRANEKKFAPVERTSNTIANA